MAPGILVQAGESGGKGKSRGPGVKKRSGDKKRTPTANPQTNKFEKVSEN